MITGKFHKVNPKGSFYRPDPTDTKIPPTTINLSRLSLRAGDFLGLQASGAYKAGGQFEDNIKAMNGVFANSGKFLEVAPPYFDRAIESLPTFPNNLPTDINQDFYLPFDEQGIFRIPSNAKELYLCPNDSKFHDNSDPNSDYGVYLSRPNNPPLTNWSSSISKPNELGLGCNLVDFYDEIEGDDFVPHGEILPEADLSNIYLMQSNSSSFQNYPGFQYRGWYRNTQTGEHVWYPRASHFMGRSSRPHYGIDVFWPIGANVYSPFSGILEKRTQQDGFGNYVRIAFVSRGQRYTLLIAHLDTIEAQNGRIAGGDLIGTAGCSGNAGAPLPCGEPNTCGGRSDHLHIEVSVGPWHPRAPRVDLVRQLQLSIKYQGSRSARVCQR